VTKLSGEYNAILDINRITLPKELRERLNAFHVVVSKGVDRCIWLYERDKWDEKVGNIIEENIDTFSRKDSRLVRKYIGSAIEQKIDSSGRIQLSDSLREYANITKDCIVLGAMDHIEIWDSKSYGDYSNEDIEDNSAEVASAAEELSRRIKKQRGID